MAKVISVRCRAWSQQPMAVERVSVDADGTVRVYDAVAGHYTVCHALSDGQQRRIRHIAQVLVVSGHTVRSH